MGNMVWTVNDDGSVDAICKQGGTWDFLMYLKTSAGVAIDLTGWTARAQIRKRYNSVDIIASFTVTVPAPQTDGKVSGILAASLTDDIPRGRYVYDVEIVRTSDTYVRRVIYGKFRVIPEVTK